MAQMLEEKPNNKGAVQTTGTDLDFIKAGGDGGASDDPGMAAPQAGGHLGSHAAGGCNQLRLIQHHPPESKLQQRAPVAAATRTGQTRI